MCVCGVCGLLVGGDYVGYEWVVIMWVMSG